MTAFKQITIIIYLVIGFLTSQFYHIYIYKIRGGTKLMTWFKSLGVADFEPSYRTAIIFCLLLSILITFSLAVLFKYYPNVGPIKVLYYGLILTAIYILFSQLIFSSVMRFGYELLFCLLVFSALMIHQIFIVDTYTNLPTSVRYQELWDVLKFIIPIMIGVPLLTGGAGFISAFYQNEHEVVKYQLYRHILMAVYFEIGAFIFIIIPILEKMLKLRSQL